MARVISCADCGTSVEARAWNRLVCNACGLAREARRRQGWWERHPNYTRERYAKDLEGNRAKGRERGRARDPEEVRRYSRARYHATKHLTKEVRAAARDRRRARKMAAPGSYTAAEFRWVCMEYGWQCAYCGLYSVTLTADHAIALSRGGSNSIDNIVPACFSCNASKQDKTPEEFTQYLKEK